MRYFSIQNGLLVVGLQVMALGCASLPDEAPQEFHSAKAALDRADKADVDDVLPNTIDRADNEFKEAVTLWKKSRDTDVKKGDRDQLLKTSKEKAVASQTLAEQGLNLNDQVKAWDGHIETYAQFVQEKQDAMAALKQAEAQNQAMAAQDHKEPAVNNPDITLRGPVAYFSPNEAEVGGRYQQNLDSLARTLSADSRAKVTLSGYTDPRGGKELNDKLAQERAESVAAILREKGVPADQIMIEDHPHKRNKNKNHTTEAQMQLDRRVEAYISNAEGGQQAR